MTDSKLESFIKLPTDRVSRNAWCRYHAKTDPIISAALSYHKNMSSGTVTHECPDRYINKFFQDIYEKLDIYHLLEEIAFEYWAIGDAFILGDFNEEAAQWDSLSLLDADYVSVDYIPAQKKSRISIIPDQRLISNIKSNDPSIDYLNDETKLNILKGQDIPLLERDISQISRKTSHYETFGTPLPAACFGTLLKKEIEFQRSDQQYRSMNEEVLKELNREIGIGMLYDHSLKANESAEKGYRTIKLAMKRWLEKKIYAPIAEANGFYHIDLSQINHQYRVVDKPKILVYPKVTII